MANKSADESFDSSWNKALAWAQTQGISTKSIAPVYQLDQQRLANGEDIMSAAERNRAILAADDPNNVTPSPADTPSPSAVFGNTRRDLGMIATGLENLPSGLFDPVKNTVEDVMDPNRAKGRTAGATAANWLQDTLLSFVPGAYDIGTYLRAGGGDQGAKALAEDPLIALLDLNPAGKWLDAGLAGTAIGDSIAARAGIESAELGKHGPAGLVVKSIMNLTPGNKAGVTAAGATKDALSIGDRLQLMLQNSPMQASKAVHDLGRMMTSGSQLQTEIYQSQLAEFMDSVQALSPPQMAEFNDLFRRHQLGENIEPLIQQASEPVKEAALAMLRGPQRWITDESVLMRDVAPVRLPSGDIAMFATRDVSTDVISARDALKAIHPEVLAELDKTNTLVTEAKRLDDAKGKLADHLEATNKVAAKAVEQDETLLENVRRETTTPKGKREILTFGTKREAAKSLFSPGGFVDNVIEDLRSGDDDRLLASSEALDRRLTEWGAKSVDAAENPAFQAVRNEIAGLKRYAEAKAKLTDEINNHIEGKGKATKAELARRADDRAKVKKQLEQKHVRERKQLRDAARHRIATIRSASKSSLADSDLRFQQMEVTEDRMNANAKVRATPDQAREIDRQTNLHKARARKAWVDTKKKTREAADRAETEAKLQAKIDASTLDKKQEAERADLEDRTKSEKLLEGETAKQVRAWTNALERFNQAVYDHPPDTYRNMIQLAYERNLLAQHVTAEVLDKAKEGLPYSAVERLESDPQVLREYVSVAFRDLFQNPGSADPELVEAAKEADAEALKSAHEEINQLILEGYKPMWLPAVGESDHIPTGVSAIVGKGTPHVDAAFERSLKNTATRHDVVLGVDKAMAQTLRRDAHIELADKMIEAYGITGADLNAFMRRNGLLEDFDYSVGKLPHAEEAKLREYGLTKFNPESTFGFSFPRYHGQNLYVPEGIARALQKYTDQEARADGLFTKGTKLFRYSILNLSPRYTAHISLGGSMMLAVRSTPYVFKFIGEASRKLREGEIPTDVFRQPTQEGSTRLEYALKSHAWAGGKQKALLAVQSELEEGMKVKLSETKPAQFLKAAGQVNMKFTRYVVRLQSAVAYLDYAAKAERKGFFEDPTTGERIAMTKERAMEEGKAHVLEVFGDLRSMTPFERAVAKNIMPFYGWQRHVLQYVLSFPMDHPWRAMVLSEVAFQNSEAVPKGLPERIQFLFDLGSLDAQGNVTAVDLRFMDPLRDVANYASFSGFFESLNPAIIAPAAMALGPDVVYGSSSLYPNVTYNQFYGIETSGSQGSPLTGLEQFIPQAQAIDIAYQAATNYRQLARNHPGGFAKTLFESLGIPGVPETINVKQIAAQDELARYRVAETAASNAFQTGDFGSLDGYSSVPNPLNPDYEITPAELSAIYNASLAAYPGQAPSSVLLPPATPAGY